MTAKLFQLNFFVLGNIMVDREHILTKANEPRKFSSEFEVPCPSAKLFYLERFAIYGILFKNYNQHNVTGSAKTLHVRIFYIPLQK